MNGGFRLFAHTGFDLMREELIPGTPVTHYAMARHPKEPTGK